MRKLIIIEGNDNSGKDTLISGLLNHFKNFKVYHSCAPKSKDSKEAAIEQWNFFAQMVDNILSDNSEISILNRSWQGEYVYGCLYRERKENDVIKDIEFLDKLVNEYLDVYYIQLIADPIVLQNNEDGLSISKGDLKKIQIEKARFEDIYIKSNLNKILINVTENGKYIPKETILNKTLNFIENVKD